MHGLSVRRGLDPADVDRLARAAAAGDGEAFEALVRAVFRRVFRWALVRVGDRDDAHDVTQRVLIGLQDGIARWEGRSRFTTWLYRVTANEASSWRRQAARRVQRLGRGSEGESDETFRGPEDLDRKRLLERVETAFRGLPRRQRQIMDLIDFQGFSPGETAELLEMNANTVRANLFKARRAIRSRILEADPTAAEVLK